MRWLINTLKSSLGYKLLMALTGLVFSAFLVIHTAGNLTLYGGREMFNNYAEGLHGMGVVLTVIEWIFVVLAAIHIATGLTLFYLNLRARPVRYKVNKRAGGRTIGSATMPYTGVLLLFFIVIHLLDFAFADKSDRTIFEIVLTVFKNPLYVTLYVAGVLLAAVHISHGFWSAFQTIGANHPKYMPFLRMSSIVFAVVLSAGLGVLPLYICFIA